MNFKKSILLILTTVASKITSILRLSAVGHPIRIANDDELCSYIVPYKFENNTTSANSVVMKVGCKCSVVFAVRHADQTQQVLGSCDDFWDDYDLQVRTPDITPALLVNVFQKWGFCFCMEYVKNYETPCIFLNIEALNPGQATLVFSIKPRDGASVCKTCSIHVAVED